MSANISCRWPAVFHWGLVVDRDVDENGVLLWLLLLLWLLVDLLIIFLFVLFFR
jgi:hypothetical protein